jgi:hypothetical protein
MQRRISRLFPQRWARSSLIAGGVQIPLWAIAAGRGSVMPCSTACTAGGGCNAGYHHRNCNQCREAPHGAILPAIRRRVRYEKLEKHKLFGPKQRFGLKQIRDVLYRNYNTRVGATPRSGDLGRHSGSRSFSGFAGTPASTQVEPAHAAHRALSQECEQIHLSVSRVRHPSVVSARRARSWELKANS